MIRLVLLRAAAGCDRLGGRPDHIAGRRPEGQFAGRDGSGRRAQGCSVQDRVEGIPGRRTAAGGVERRRDRNRSGRRCAVHLCCCRQCPGQSDRRDPADAGRARDTGAEEFSDPRLRRSEGQEDRDRPRLDRASADFGRARIEGLVASDVQIVFLAPSDAKVAYTQGSVDAWSTWEPYVSQEEVLFQSRRVITAEGLTPGLGFQVATPMRSATSGRNWKISSGGWRRRGRGRRPMSEVTRRPGAS